MTSNEYFKIKALSNSLLSTMSNPRWVKMKLDNPDMEDDDKKHFRIGGALDCLLTQPALWEKEFEVVDIIRPFGLMAKFVDNLPDGLTVESSLELYQNAYDKSGYKMKIDRVISKLWENEDIKSYYLATRMLDKSKKILSKDEYESVLKSKELIQANEYIQKYFYEQSISSEILRQVAIVFEYMGETCKALLDGILIDHANKTITPYDLKTIGKSVYTFANSFLEYGYYRQCAFYNFALTTSESPIIKYIHEGYHLEDFRFIVVESKVSSSHPAIIYKTTEKDRDCGMNGGYVGRRYYKGINELIEAYKYHKVTDYWDLPLDLIKSRGEITLDIFNNAEEHELYTADDGL